MKIKFNKNNVKKLFLSIGLGSTIVYSTMSAGPFINPETNFVDFYYIDTKNTKLSNQEFLDKFNEIVDSRKDLSNEWSDIRNELNEFILENGNYLNQERVLEMVSNVKIKHDDNMSNVLATTNIINNTIKYNRRFDVKKEEEQKEVKLHEAYHLLFGKSFYADYLNFSHIGRGLDEGFAQLLTEESNAYVGTTIFNKQTIYVKAICELIGKDKFLDAINSNDVGKLIKYLGTYSSLNDAIKLIQYIDKSYKDYYNILDADKEAWQIIDKMYEKKNGIDIKNSKDEIMKVYSNKLGETDYSITGAKGYLDGVVNKNYFINEHTPATIILKSQNTKYGELVLDSNNNVVNILNEESNYKNK